MATKLDSVGKPVVFGGVVHGNVNRFRNEFGNIIELSGGFVDGLLNYQMAGPDSVTDQTMTRIEAIRLRNLLNDLLEDSSK